MNWNILQKYFNTRSKFLHPQWKAHFVHYKSLISCSLAVMLKLEPVCKYLNHHLRNPGPTSLWLEQGWPHFHYSKKLPFWKRVHDLYTPIHFLKQLVCRRHSAKLPVDFCRVVYSAQTILPSYYCKRFSLIWVKFPKLGWWFYWIIHRKVPRATLFDVLLVSMMEH